MSHLILSHLSKNNNSRDLVKELFQKHADGTKIIVASRDQETEIYTIFPGGKITGNKIKKSKPPTEKIQLTLF